MKIRLWLFLLLAGTLLAEPTQNRTWTSKANTNFEGKAVSLSGGKVTLIGKGGRKIVIPIERLSDKDVSFLRKHFREAAAKAKAPENLSIPLGKLSERTKADDDSFYRIYLPKTMDAEVPPPILFFAAYGGYKEGLVGRFYEAAEVAGVALAISAEKQNPGAGFFDKSLSNARDCLKHIKRNYPVDTSRAIFSGTSGDGAASFKNADELKCIGAIPYVSYIPQGTSINKKIFYHIGGGARDYNRYASARAASKAGDRAVHRIWDGGHASARPPEAFEGLIWVYTRHIYENPDKHQREIAVFEPRFSTWLNKAKAKRPYVVYYWTDHLLNTCKIQGDFAAEMRALNTELAENVTNVKYLHCHRAISEFSRNYYAPEVKSNAAQSKQGHITAEIEDAAKELNDRYSGVPELSKALRELGIKTEG